MENQYSKKVYSGLMLLLIIGAFLLGYFTFYFHQKSLVEKPTSTVPVTNSLVLNAMPLKAQDIEFTNEYIGHIVAIHEAFIQPYISGYIDKIMVSGGQYVKKGDVLVVLEQSQYKAALDASYADILKANANLSNAKTYFERTQKAKSAVSQTEIDNAKAEFLSAQASLGQANANFELAKVNYGYTFLSAPVDGIVGDVSLTKGNYVSPSSGALFSIVQLSPIRVVFSITDKEYLKKSTKNNLFDNQEIFLKLSNDEIFPNKGTFKYSDNLIEKASNSINIYADFENIGKTLMPNAYVTVLVKETFDNALKISKEFIMLDEQGSFVYLIRDGKIARENLKILADGNTFFIVQNTFGASDYLITQTINPKDLGKPATIKVKDTK
ncbi:MAG: efflux RND transporter periplasmic adaptor subunit [Alphaproteobacteria bacterium]|nr:efflux RND transporter periplasmic adaptor subunit [Alphaproteobacteria bacterium]